MDTNIARIFGLGEAKADASVQETKENEVATSETVVSDSLQGKAASEQEAVTEDAAVAEKTATEETKEAVADAVVAEEAAVEETSGTDEQAEEAVYITPGMEWRATMKTLEEQVEKELSKANSVINDIIAEEKARCRALVEKQYQDKENAMVAAHTKEVSDMKEQYEEQIIDLRTKLEEAEEKQKAEVEEAVSKQKEEMEEAIAKQKEECDAELEKMKTLYAQQLDEVQEAFREKTVSFRKEIDQYKEQIEVLMLHIDDPFVLQEMEMKQTQEAAEAAAAESKA